MDLKSADYYGTPRNDLLEWMDGTGHARVLEIGCGAGANAPWLRSHGAVRIVGIEPEKQSAQTASRRFDEVHQTTVEAVLHDVQGPFDLVICADVLEHLVDPGSVIEGLRGVIAEPTGRLLISTPNIRYISALARIAVGAGFRPEMSGTFDSTHIRFFTRANLRDLLRRAGWYPERWGYPRSTALGHLRTVLGRLTRGVSDEWLAAEWFVIARPAPIIRRTSGGGSTVGRDQERQDALELRPAEGDRRG